MVRPSLPLCLMAILLVGNCRAKAIARSRRAGIGRADHVFSGPILATDRPRQPRRSSVPPAVLRFIRRRRARPKSSFRRRANHERRLVHSAAGTRPYE